jgi:hypothetical protein
VSAVARPSGCSTTTFFWRARAGRHAGTEADQSHLLLDQHRLYSKHVGVVSPTSRCWSSSSVFARHFCAGLSRLRIFRVRMYRGCLIPIGKRAHRKIYLLCPGGILLALIATETRMPCINVVLVTCRQSINEKRKLSRRTQILPCKRSILSVIRVLEAADRGL